jgi:tetratricopeptide (TPR) repeat protein
MLEQILDIAPLPNAPREQNTDESDPKTPMKASGHGWPRESAIALHQRLGEIYLERKRYEDAELAWSCAVGVARMEVGRRGGGPVASPAETADLLAHHAESLHLLGREEQAKARVDEALRLDETNETANRLHESISR